MNFTECCCREKERGAVSGRERGVGCVFVVWGQKRKSVISVVVAAERGSRHVKRFNWAAATVAAAAPVEAGACHKPCLMISFCVLQSQRSQAELTNESARGLLLRCCCCCCCLHNCSKFASRQMAKMSQLPICFVNNLRLWQIKSITHKCCDFSMAIKMVNAFRAG